ncbi:peptidylprolyl isomerase [Paenibacillus marinisediminis]
MTNEVKSLWGCIIVLFICVVVLGGMLLFRIDIPKRGAVPDQEQEQSSVLAVVGNEPILKEQWIEELQRQYGSMVLERMMTIKAVEMEAAALHIQVSEEEVEAELRREMYGYESVEAYYTAMQEQLGLSPEQINKDLHYHLMLEKVAVHGIEVSDEEIEQYIDLHEDEISNPVSMQLSHIVVPDLDTANLALERLEAGESFEQVAEALSTDSFTSQQGGKLGWIDENDPFLAANERMMAVLLDVGTWSQPVKVADGYAIVMLTGRKEIDLYSSESLRERVRNEVALSKAPSLVEVEEQLKKKYNARVLNYGSIPES